MLNANERGALVVLVTELIEANQPFVVLGVLHRIAERMTMRAIRRNQPIEADDWMRLAKALEKLLRV